MYSPVKTERVCAHGERVEQLALLRRHVAVLVDAPGVVPLLLAAVADAGAEHHRLQVSRDPVRHSITAPMTHA